MTNPKTYDFIHGVYNEAMELFGWPRYFHIGHDEIAITARYPFREDAKKLGEGELFVRDVKSHERFFSPKGTQVMLWGDMLLAKGDAKDACNAPSKEEAKRRRDALPRDAIICDWHYDAVTPDKYTSLKIFKDEGFKTIACPWYDPANIANFSQAAREASAWGTLQTTWAGYHVTRETLDREMRQFSAYILAAEYAWSADSPPPAELSWRAEEVLARALNPRRMRAKPTAGVRIDLSAAANVKPDRWMNAEGAGLGAMDLKERVAGLAFEPAGGAIVLDGALLSRSVKAPRSVTLEATLPYAAEINFLHATCAPAAGGQIVGWYTVSYADGTSEKIPLRYGREIRAAFDTAPASVATGGWFGKTKNGLDAAIRVFSWTNPHPERAITSITLASEHAYASLALFGLNALEN